MTARQIGAAERAVWFVDGVAGSGGAVAGDADLAAGGRGAFEGRAGADAGDAGVVDRAGVAVVARAAIVLDWVGADPGPRVAGSGVMALIARGANDRVAAGADARLTRIGLRAGVAVIARAAIGFRRVGADAGGRIADAGQMALIEGGAGARRAHARAVRLAERRPSCRGRRRRRARRR